jgi:hypothetical protein
MKSQREKLLATIKDFDKSLENLEKSMTRLRAMRQKVIDSYVANYGTDNLTKNYRKRR